jgi:hypothetical protein
VTEATGPGLVPPLESSGRRNVAVSGDHVAVVWEDDRDGTPRIHLARKGLTDTAFDREVQVSGDGEAFEPSIVGLDNGRFVVAWEEDGRVHARTIGEAGQGPLFTVDSSDSVQPSLGAHGDEVLLTTAERDGRFSRIRLHRLHPEQNGSLRETSRCAVDAEAPRDDQLYPTPTAASDSILVAWEDRRPGHTIIMAAEGLPSAECGFAPPRRISLRPESRGNMPYGKGHGVSRVTLTPYGPSAVYAAWADKRDFREGYDIYGAAWQPQAGFGANERIQDAFGGVARQWHVSLAGHPDGSLVAAWDDERDGDPNIMLSWREDGTWSEDLALPGADGPGVQAHPSITLDAKGSLHAAWIERDAVNGPTRLLYLFGRRLGD